MTARTTLRLAAAVLIACALGAGACSVSTNEEPVAAGDIFQDFLETTTTTTAVTTPAADSRPETVWFLDTSGGATRLEDVTREFDLDAGIEEVLASLVTVPPDTEGAERIAESGLTTAIPESAALSSAALASPGSTELVVDVSGLFGSIAGSQLRNALAQIVWTATEPPGVDSVSFRADGEQVSPIIGSGETVDRPVDTSDYRTLG